LPALPSSSATPVAATANTDPNASYAAQATATGTAAVTPQANAIPASYPITPYPATPYASTQGLGPTAGPVGTADARGLVGGYPRSEYATGDASTVPVQTQPYRPEVGGQPTPPGPLAAAPETNSGSAAHGGESQAADYQTTDHSELGAIQQGPAPTAPVSSPYSGNVVGDRYARAPATPPSSNPPATGATLQSPLNSPANAANATAPTGGGPTTGQAPAASPVASDPVDYQGAASIDPRTEPDGGLYGPAGATTAAGQAPDPTGSGLRPGQQDPNATVAPVAGTSMPGGVDPSLDAAASAPPPAQQPAKFRPGGTSDYVNRMAPPIGGPTNMPPSPATPPVTGSYQPGGGYPAYPTGTPAAYPPAAQGSRPTPVSQPTGAGWPATGTTPPATAPATPSYRPTAPSYGGSHAAGSPT
jgi:hypothetical protein